MWIIMAKGKTYYVDHVEANLPWTTKETPDNVKTKGAIKFKDCLVTITDDNCAKIGVLTPADAARIRNAERGITRVITKWGAALSEALQSLDIKHGPIKRIGGGCGRSFYITDIFNNEDLTTLTLSLVGRTDFRILMPNEIQYKWYDDKDSADDELYDDEDDEDEDEEYA